jgi:hypothetical protein
VLTAITRVRLLSAPVGVCFATFVFVFSMRMELAVVLRNGMYIVAAMILFLILGAAVWNFQNGARGYARTHHGH